MASEARIKNDILFYTSSLCNILKFALYILSETELANEILHSMFSEKQRVV